MALSWTQVDDADTGGVITWHKAVWAASIGLFVAVGNRSANVAKIETSPDGVVWTLRNTVTAGDNLSSVAWSSSLSLLVATVSNAARVVTSPDGINWTNRAVPNDNSWGDVVWADTLNLFVAVGGIGASRVMTSPDGITWTNRSASSAHVWQSIAWSGTELIAAADESTSVLMRSTDGINWTDQSFGVSIRVFPRTLGWASSPINLFAAATTTNIYTSPTGVSWTARNPSHLDSAATHQFAFSPDSGLWVVGGALGTSADDTLDSMDGVTWSRSGANVNFRIDILTYSHALRTFVGIEDFTHGKVAYATDSVTVPDVVGLSEADAVTALEAVGLIEGTATQGGSLTVPVGDVISQNPAAGSSVAGGSAVNLVISVGVAPTDLTATPQADGCVVLDWTDNTAGWITDQEAATAQVRVAIYRKEGTDGYYSFLNYAEAAGPYTDCSVFPDINYGYRVQAMKTGALGQPLLNLQSNPWTSIVVDNIIFYYYLGQPIYGKLPSGGTFAIGSAYTPAPSIAPPLVTELSELSDEALALTYPPVPTITDAAYSDETGFVTVDWEALRAGPPQNQGTITYTLKRTLTSGTGYTTVASGIADAVGFGTQDDADFTFGVPNYYIIIATNATGDSAPSVEAVVTPDATASIIPNIGCAGTAIAIINESGAFQAGDTVAVGGVAATSVVVVSKNRITCVTGAHADGLVNVVVTHHPSLGTITYTNAYTYGTPWWKRTLTVLLNGQTFTFELWVNQCTAPTDGTWDLGTLVDPRLWWHYPPLNYYIYQETSPGTGWSLGAPVSNDGWFSSTAEFSGSISVIDGGVPAKPRKWSDISTWAASGAAMLGGAPAASAGIDNRIVYPATGYTVGTDYPPIRIFDGTFDHEIARLPPTTSNTVPRAVLAMLAANGTVYLTTFDSGTTSADWRGRVFQLDHQNGELTPLGTNFAAGEMPYALAWHMGRLWCGTNNGIGTVGKVYYFRPGIDTTWTLDHSLATDSLGGVDSMMSYKGKLYVGSDNAAGSRGKVLQRDTVGVYTVVETGAGGTARVNNGYLSMTVFQENLYTAYWNNDTTAIAYIRKFDGTSWTTAYTGATTTLKPYIVLFSEDDNMFALGGGLLLPAAILRTSNGTSWTDLSSFLPDATHTLLPIYGVEIL